jgi:hypothetical protein
MPSIQLTWEAFEGDKRRAIRMVSLQEKLTTLPLVDGKVY